MKACFQIAECSLSSTKIVQTSAMKACFQIAECSLSSTKIHFTRSNYKILPKDLGFFQNSYFMLQLIGLCRRLIKRKAQRKGGAAEMLASNDGTACVK